MTGDGTNDAPAMRLADVGIAIGANATEAAKEASDLVVVDERIETLVNGVVEGRAMWASLKEGIAILVGGNLGEVVFTLAGQAIGGTPPVNARQLLLVNLFTDVAPALAIALRRPRRTKLEDLLHEGPEASLGRALDQRIVNRAMTTAAAASVAWVLGRATGSPQRASTIATAALVTSQLGQTLATSWHDPTAVGAVALSAVGLVASVQSPGLSGFFGCTPLGPVGWAIPIAVGGMAAGAAVAIGALARREGDGSGSSAALTREPESDGAAVAHDATRRAPTPA
jgi:cation-transporting ATPase I